MKPRIAICNIFDQDADRLVDFAVRNGFEGIDWTIGTDQSEKTFVSQMEKLGGLEVRFHCAFSGIDFRLCRQQVGEFHGSVNSNH